MNYVFQFAEGWLLSDLMLMCVNLVFFVVPRLIKESPSVKKIVYGAFLKMLIVLTAVFIYATLLHFKSKYEIESNYWLFAIGFFIVPVVVAGFGKAIVKTRALRFNTPKCSFGLPYDYFFNEESSIDSLIGGIQIYAMWTSYYPVRVLLWIYNIPTRNYRISNMGRY